MIDVEAVVAELTAAGVTDDAYWISNDGRYCDGRVNLVLDGGQYRVVLKEPDTRGVDHQFRVADNAVTKFISEIRRLGR